MDPHLQAWPPVPEEDWQVQTQPIFSDLPVSPGQRVGVRTGSRDCRDWEVPPPTDCEQTEHKESQWQASQHLKADGVNPCPGTETMEEEGTGSAQQWKGKGKLFFYPLFYSDSQGLEDGNAHREGWAALPSPQTQCCPWLGTMFNLGSSCQL